MYANKIEPASIDFDQKTIITVPNLITISRLIVLPFILILLNKGYNIWAGILIIFCGITDVLDGFLARTLHQVTSFGKILDPIVDKIFYLAIMVFLLFYKNFPLWIFIIVIILEFLILAGSYMLITKYRTIPSANIYGKVAVCLISLAIFLYVIDLHLFKTNIILEFSLQKIILILGVVELLVATASYVIRAKAMIKKRKSERIVNPIGKH